jgi:hypothetical protein
MLDKGELKGAVSVFLADGYVPQTWMYVNDASLLPSDVSAPEDRIIVFRIRDQHAPLRKSDFKLLVEVLVNELEKGGTVAVSCHGGHGRTGLLLAVLYGKLTGSQEPVEEMRKWHCDQAVETHEQKKFVHKFLGLPEPKVDTKPCRKCHKNPQWVDEVSGKKDIWCKVCVDEWELKRAEEKANAKPIGFITSGESAAPIHPIHASRHVSVGTEWCDKCKMRRAHAQSTWCAQCIASESMAKMSDEEKVKYWTDQAVAVCHQWTRAKCQEIVTELMVMTKWSDMQERHYGLLGALDWPDDLMNWE